MEQILLLSQCKHAVMDSQHIQNIISRTHAQREANRLALLDLQDKLSAFKNQLYHFNNDLQQAKMKFGELTANAGISTDARVKTMMPVSMHLVAS
jgi:predicted  nucleic acid-binding Zn-ribbon protein